MHQRYVSRRSHSYRASPTPLPPGPGRYGQRSMHPSMRCKQPGTCVSISAAHHPTTHLTQLCGACQRIHARSVRSPCTPDAHGGLAWPVLRAQWLGDGRCAWSSRSTLCIARITQRHECPCLPWPTACANPIDRRTQCRTPAPGQGLRCANPPACSPGSIRRARTSYSTLYTHGHGQERGARSRARSRVSTRAREGPGTGRGRERTGAAGRRGMGACSQLSGSSLRRRRAAPRCAAHGTTRRKGRGAAGRTVAGLRSRPTRTVEGARQGQGGGALSRVALVSEMCRSRAASARRVERAQRRCRRGGLAGLWR